MYGELFSNLNVTLALVKIKESIEFETEMLESVHPFFNSKFYLLLSVILSINGAFKFFMITKTFSHFFGVLFSLFMILFIALPKLLVKLKLRIKRVRYDELNEHHRNIMLLLQTNSKIPIDYYDSRCVLFCAFYVKNKRADTVKEALNLYSNEWEIRSIGDQLGILDKTNEAFVSSLPFIDETITWNDLLIQSQRYVA